MRETEAPRRLETGPGGQGRPRKGISGPLITEQLPQSGPGVGRGRAGTERRELPERAGQTSGEVSAISRKKKTKTMRSVIWPKRAMNWAIRLWSRFSSSKLPEIRNATGLVPGSTSVESPAGVWSLSICAVPSRARHSGMCLERAPHGRGHQAE